MGSQYSKRISPPPTCTSGLSSIPATVQSGGTSSLSISGCGGVGPPPAPPYVPSPYTPGDSPVCTTATVVQDSSTSTSWTGTWTAPICNDTPDPVVCRPNVLVRGTGGETTYATTPPSITIPSSGRINVEIKDITNGAPCDAGAPFYTATDVAVEAVRGGIVFSSGTATNGQYTFTCLPNDTYTVSMQVPSGFQMYEPATNSQTAEINNDTKTARFCITNFEPWYQTESGDIKMRGIVNPIPAGLFGSTDPNYPGVFYSTRYNSVVSAGGSVSGKGWAINKGYDYNSLTQNRNGTVTYSFYKSRARQEGIPITALQAGTLDSAEITGSGIYEYTGVLTIDSYSQIPDRALVLVNGNVTINSEIKIPEGKLFILAASGNITISENVGHASPGFNTTASNLEGYYSAEGSIILEGTGCTGGEPDRRLNVGGALVANALKPFASDGTGTIQNNRSLCTNDDLYPSLYVSSRPDFLTKLTDFYKVSYTKWREVRP